MRRLPLLAAAVLGVALAVALGAPPTSTGPDPGGADVSPASTHEIGGAGVSPASTSETAGTNVSPASPPTADSDEALRALEVADVQDPVQAREERRALADARAREAFEARLAALEGEVPDPILEQARQAAGL